MSFLKRFATVIIPIVTLLISGMILFYNYATSNAHLESNVQDNTDNMIDLWSAHGKDVERLQEESEDVERKVIASDQRAAVTESRMGDVKSKVDSIEDDIDVVRLEQVEQRVQLTNVKEDTKEIKEDVKSILRKLNERSP